MPTFANNHVQRRFHAALLDRALAMVHFWEATGGFATVVAPFGVSYILVFFAVHETGAQTGV